MTLINIWMNRDRLAPVSQPYAALTPYTLHTFIIMAYFPSFVMSIYYSFIKQWCSHHPASEINSSENRKETSKSHTIFHHLYFLNLEIAKQKKNGKEKEKIRNLNHRVRWTPQTLISPPNYILCFASLIICTLHTAHTAHTAEPMLNFIELECKSNCRKKMKKFQS